MDRPKGEIALEIFESFFDRNELQIIAPKLCRVLFIPVLRQQLHLYTRPRLMPWLLQQLLLISGETTLRRADQVLHRWIARAHLLQDLFGWNAPIHHPDAARLAVLLLDASQKAAQSRLVLFPAITS